MPRIEEGFSAGISAGREEKKGLSRRQKIFVGLSAGAIVVAGAIAGGYFFPRGEKEAVTPIVTPKPSEAAGTPEGARVVVSVPEGETLKAGNPAIVREIDWRINTVWLWTTDVTTADLKVGRGYDGNIGHDRAIWTSQAAWPWMKDDMNAEATRIMNGSLGSRMTINIPDGKGGFKTFS